MFSATLVNISIWKPVLQNSVLRVSLAWLQKNADTAELGNYPLDEPGWYVNIHGYETLTEAECCWENHKHTIDIQYLISGCEGIRWGIADRLGSPLCYREEKRSPGVQSSRWTQVTYNDATRHVRNLYAR